jgi:hypothetical protein
VSTNAGEAHSFWREAQFDTIRLCLIKVAGRVTEMVTRIKVALPNAFPYQTGFASLRRPYRQAAAVNDGAGCPRTNPAAQPQTPITRVPDATENSAPTDGPAQLSPTPMNNSG